MNLRQYLAVAGAAVFGVITTACASAPPADELRPGVAPEAPQAPAPPQPKRGGTVVYGCLNGSTTLNPYLTAATGDRRTLGPIYESLLTNTYEPGFDYRIDFDVLPWLASRWEQAGPTTYVLHMREGVRWHDGERFTAEDVAFSVQYAKDAKNGFAAAKLLFDVEGAEVVDQSRVRFTLKRTSVNFLTDLANLNLMILPKHVFDRGDDFKKVAIGTGPYKFGEFKAGDRSYFTRFDGYWQEGRPYPDAVDCLYISDDSTRQSAFIAQKTDLIHVNDRKQVEGLQRQRPDLKFAPFITDYNTSLLLKLEQPPFNDIRVRRALHLAIDRPGLIKNVTYGDGVISPPGSVGAKTGWAIPQEELLAMPGFRADKAADIAEAKRLLAEAGYPDGFSFKVVYTTEGVAPARIVEPLAAQVRLAGITAELQGTTAAPFRVAERDGLYETLVTYVGDMAFQRQRDYLHSQSSLNKMGLNDKELDQLIERQGAEADVEKRRQAHIAMQRLLLEKLYIIPTVEIPGYAAWQPWVHNYAYNIGSATFVDQATASRTWLDVDAMPSGRR